MDIQRTREDTKKCEKENAELSKEFTKTQDRIGELDNEIVKAEEDYKKLYLKILNNSTLKSIVRKKQVI